MTSPTRRLRSASVRECDRPGGQVVIEDVVDAVISRLTAAGLIGGGDCGAGGGEDGAAGGGGADCAVKTERPEDVEPSPSQRRLWITELREQLTMSRYFGTREKEEVRGLLIIGEGAGRAGT